MKTDVLFLHRQLAFAVSIKQALERTNSYDVHPFTSVEAALEYLRGHRQGLVLIDFAMPVASGEELVERVRQVQPDIAVIATPEQSDEELARLNLQASIGAGFTARDLIPVIEQALEGHHADLQPKRKTTGLLNRMQTGELPILQSPAASEDATLVQGLPAMPAPEAAAEVIDLFADAGETPLDTQEVPEVAAEPAPTTEKLTNLDPFGTEELPELNAFTSQEPGIQTERLEADEGEALVGPEYGLGPEFGTRPLAEIEAEEAAVRFGEQPVQFETLEEALAASLAPDEEIPPGIFGSVEPEFPSAFDAGVLDHESPFAGFDDEESTGGQPVDYLAELNLQPTPSDAPPWLQEVEPEVADEDVHTRLERLFSGVEEPAPALAAAEDDFTFDDLSQAVNEPEDPFAGLLADLGGDAIGDNAAGRERSAFDELVASMSSPEQRAPLPARQQQYVDVSLTDDFSSVMEQIEQARTGGETPPVGPDFGPVDLSAVLFEDEEEGGDTPVGQATAFDEAPALASPEELAALFASPRSAEPTELESDFEALFAAPAQSAEEPEADAAFAAGPGDAAMSDAEFEALFPTRLEPADVDLESQAVFGTGPGEASSPEVNLESLFAGQDEPAAPEVGLDALFDEPAAQAASGQDIFSGDWASSDLVDLDDSPGFEETGTVSDLMSGVGEVTGHTGRTGMLTRLEGELPPVADHAPGSRPLPSAETAPAPPPIDDSVTALLAEIELQLAASPPPPITDLDRSLPEDSGDTPARRILETTSDATQSDSSFSLDHLIQNIEAQLPPSQAKVKPLPSWTRAPAPPPPSVPELAFEDETLVHAPPAEETIAHAVTTPDVDAADSVSEPPFDWEAASFDDTTVMGEAARAEQIALTGDEETSWLEFIEPEADTTAAHRPDAVVPAPAEAAQPEPIAAQPDWEAIDAEAEASARALQADHIDDPYIAQLAVSLTDVSLELTAEAVLLTRERDIVAFAGRMSRDELLELRQEIDDDWEAAANDARIRFLRLPAAGKDVMLYSRRTVEDLTMSLVFDGAMPLRDIRQQSKRLMDALAAVPDAPAEVVLETPPEAEEPPAEEIEDGVARSPHAYVWLLRDPNATLIRPIAQAIVTGIHQQMRDHGWRIRELRASEDHVYLLAESPDEQPPYVAVRELMRRSAQIAHVQNPALDPATLWADAYLVVTPGRPLEPDEIQQFIQFERMA